MMKFIYNFGYLLLIHLFSPSEINIIAQRSGNVIASPFFFSSALRNIFKLSFIPSGRIRINKKASAVLFLVFGLIVSVNINLYAENNVLTSAAFTHGGWAGARYAAMGKASEAVADDVYSIYWNPAGLRELKQREALTSEEIKKKVSEGDIDSITEKDLTRFSEEEYSRTFVQIGASCVLLDPDNAAGFAGVAFGFYKGVLGIGYYGWRWKEDRVESGSGKEAGHLASAGYISYGQGIGPASIGFSLKPVYVNLENVRYYGMGADLGMQIEMIPLVKVGIVIQDLGSGLKPAGNHENTDSKYDFISPTVRFGASVTDRSSDFILAVSGSRKLNENKFKVNFGFQYNIFKFSSLYLGVGSALFSSGISLRFFDMDITYAFMYDKYDFGYANMLSVTMVI